MYYTDGVKMIKLLLIFIFINNSAFADKYFNIQSRQDNAKTGDDVFRTLNQNSLKDRVELEEHPVIESNVLPYITI